MCSSVKVKVTVISLQRLCVSRVQAFHTGVMSLNPGKANFFMAKVTCMLSAVSDCQLEGHGFETKGDCILCGKNQITDIAGLAKCWTVSYKLIGFSHRETGSFWQKVLQVHVSLGRVLVCQFEGCGFKPQGDSRYNLSSLLSWYSVRLSVRK